jgi:hypothetical protein
MRVVGSSKTYIQLGNLFSSNGPSVFDTCRHSVKGIIQAGVSTGSPTGPQERLRRPVSCMRWQELARLLSVVWVSRSDLGVCRIKVRIDVLPNMRKAVFREEIILQTS